MSDFHEAMKEISRANDLLDVITTLRRQNAALRGAIQYALDGCVDLISTEEGKRLEHALYFTPAAPDGNREKAELLDWLIEKGFQRAEASLGGLPGKEWVNFKIWFQVPEPKGWPLYEDAEWTKEQLLAALRAAKAGGK